MINGRNTNPAYAHLKKTLASGIMIALLLGPVQAAIQKVSDEPADTQVEERSPKPTRISTAELVANPERVFGKKVLVRARVEKSLGPHWFAINEGSGIP